MAGITGSHHVLGIKHLLSQFRNGERPVLLASTGSEWCESGHEEVEAGEGDHVDGQFSQISIELAWEAQTGSHSRHGQRDQMVQISISRIGQSESAEADVIESFIVNAVGLVSVLDQLVDGQGCIVRLHHSVGHLGRWYNRVGVHDAVWILLTDLGDEQSSHAGSSTTSKRVGELESLKAVARLSFFAHNIQNRVNKLSSWKQVKINCRVLQVKSLDIKLSAPKSIVLIGTLKGIFTS